MTNIIGIDPGKNGGYALIDHANLVVYSFKDKTEQDIAEQFRMLATIPNTIAYLEKVHAAPGQGVVSMFTFGQNYGLVRGFLAAFKIPFIDVTPQEWQRGLRIPSKNGKTYNEHKKMLRQIAGQLYPNVKTNAETADALLIAHYGKLKQNKMDI